MELSELIKDCYSVSEFCRKLGFSTGGGGFIKAKKLINDNNLDISHFDGGHGKKIINPLITKICPVCGESFKTKKHGNKKEKVTCSHRCSNSYFRKGEDNGNWKQDSYRSTCFLYHKKECVICGENKIIDVHHMDENNKNNNPNNLIPLCPTHHQYWHSRYKNEIEDKVYEYVKEIQNCSIV